MGEGREALHRVRQSGGLDSRIPATRIQRKCGWSRESTLPKEFNRTGDQLHNNISRMVGVNSNLYATKEKMH